MDANSSPRRAWLAAGASVTVLCALCVAAPARAAASNIDSIEKQIRALQAELHHVKAEMARKDAAEKRAAAQHGPGFNEAVYGRDIHGNPVYLGPGVGMARASGTQPAGSPYLNVEGTPHNVMAKLGQGTFMVGGVSVTLGGFVDVTGVYRSRTEGNDVASDFGNGIPFRNVAAGHMNQFLMSGRASRLSILAQDDATPNTHLAAYYEMDFQSAGTSSNPRESNSYTLRVRNVYGTYYNHDWDLKILGGQSWSLATAYKVGLTERQENAPLAIDHQYVPGFTWTRQAGIRIVKGFDHSKYHLGLAFEEPQTLYASAGPNGIVPASVGTITTSVTGGGTNNNATSYTTEIAPDTILKIAADPGWGHYELFGLMRFFQARQSLGTWGTNHVQIAGGGGGSTILPLIKGKLDLQLSGTIGKGIGRYGTSQLPDATFDAAGHIVPLTNLQALGGLVYHPVKTVDLYAYGGTERVLDRADFTVGGKGYGYGSPLYNNSGCNIEGSAATLCVANTRAITQGTVGYWWRALKGPFGTLQNGLQYSYTKRQIFSGIGGSPKTDDNIVMLSFRYLPFQ